MPRLPMAAHLLPANRMAALAIIAADFVALAGASSVTSSFAACLPLASLAALAVAVLAALASLSPLAAP